MTTQTSCNMSFVTSLGGTRVVRIQNPQSNMTISTAMGAAGRIASANPFDDTVGTLEAIKRIEIVATSRNRLF